MAAAMRFAEKRRLGPFASGAPDRDARRKAAAAMLRAGHGFDIVRRILDAPPGELPIPKSHKKTLKQFTSAQSHDSPPAETGSEPTEG
jgi:hypothetical protein